MRRALTWYGVRSSTRASQTSFGSPIETHTSVCTKSAPCSPSAGSSVRVIRAPDASPARAAVLDHVLVGPEVLGRADADVRAHDRAHHQQGAAHVEPAVAHEAVADLVRAAARRRARTSSGSRPASGSGATRRSGRCRPARRSRRPAPRPSPAPCRGTRSRRTSATAPGRCRRPTPCARSGTSSGRGR